MKRRIYVPLHKRKGKRVRGHYKRNPWLNRKRKERKRKKAKKRLLKRGVKYIPGVGLATDIKETIEDIKDLTN